MNIIKKLAAAAIAVLSVIPSAAPSFTAYSAALPNKDDYEEIDRNWANFCNTHCISTMRICAVPMFLIKTDSRGEEIVIHMMQKFRFSQWTNSKTAPILMRLS